MGDLDLRVCGDLFVFFFGGYGVGILIFIYFWRLRIVSCYRDIVIRGKVRGVGIV